VSGRVRESGWASLGAAAESTTDVGGWQSWHLIWKPETIARSGDDIDYQVQLDDGGPPFWISLGKFTYDPVLPRLWRDNQTAVIGGLTALALLLIYAGYFAGMLMVAPARRALIGGAPGLCRVHSVCSTPRIDLALGEQLHRNRDSSPNGCNFCSRAAAARAPTLERRAHRPETEFARGDDDQHEDRHRRSRD
jgi:hypothetical protein